jgi:hypothetical protein
VHELLKHQLVHQEAALQRALAAIHQRQQVLPHLLLVYGPLLGA